VLEVGADAYRAEQDVGFEGDLAGGCLDLGLDAVAAGIYAGDLAAGEDIDAVFLIILFELFGDLFVFHGNDAGEEFDDGHLCSHAEIEVGELHADGAAAYDDDATRFCLRGHSFAVADDLFAVLLEIGQLTATGAGRDDDMFPFDDHSLAVGAGDFHLAFGLQFSITQDHVDLVLAHQELNAFAHLVRYAAAAFDHAGEVHAATGFDAVVFCMEDILHYLSTL